MQVKVMQVVKEKYPNLHREGRYLTEKEKQFLANFDISPRLWTQFYGNEIADKYAVQNLSKAARLLECDVKQLF